MIKIIGAPGVTRRIENNHRVRREKRLMDGHAVGMVNGSHLTFFLRFSSQEEFVICKTLKAILTDLVEKDVRCGGEHERTQESEGASGKVGNIVLRLRTTFVEMAGLSGKTFCAVWSLTLTCLAIPLNSERKLIHPPQSSIASAVRVLSLVNEFGKARLRHSALDTGRLIEYVLSGLGTVSNHLEMFYENVKFQTT